MGKYDQSKMKICPVFCMKQLGFQLIILLMIYTQGEAANPVITTKSLPAGKVGIPYKGQLQALGNEIFKWEPVGVPSQGLTISEAGFVSVDPKNSGELIFTVKITDITGLSSVGDVSILINLSIETDRLPDGEIDVPYKFQLIPHLGPNRWKVVGELPAGLSFIDSGEISGNPNKEGIGYFDVQLLEGNKAIQRTLSIKINKPQELRTNRPFTLEYIAGADFSLERNHGNKNFSSGKPNFGIKIDARLNECLRSFVTFKLTSILVEQQDSDNQQQSSTEPPTEDQLTQEKSLEANGGLHIKVWTWSAFSPEHAVETAILLKAGIQTSETEEQAIPKTFIGLRFLNTGNLSNSAYIDIGYGHSQNFKNAKGRIKIDGFLPFYETPEINYFVASSIDIGNGNDGVMFTAGALFKIDRIFNLFVFPKPQEKKEET